MRLFQAHQTYLAIVGVERLKNQPTIVLVKRSMIFIIAVLYVSFAIVFLGHQAKTLNEYADSFYGSVSTFGFSVIFGIIVWKMDSLFRWFEDFETLVEQRMKSPKWKPRYEKLNENIEKWTGFFYFFLVKVTLPGMMIPKLSMSFYLYFATDLANEALILPYPTWAPFDCTTPIGYLIIFTLECSAVFCVCHVCACYIGTFVASCYLIFTFCDEIKSEIHALDKFSEVENNSVAAMRKVGDIVKLHVAAKQLVFDMDNIFAIVIIIHFLWGLSTICSTLLVVQIGLEQNVNPLELIRPIFVAFWSFAELFLICEFGQMLTDHFDQLMNVIYDCDWISFPKEVQQILPIIIQNTQREVVVETFKNASCSRESFKNLVNAGFSYFMIFRKFR